MWHGWWPLRMWCVVVHLYWFLEHFNWLARPYITCAQHAVFLHIHKTLPYKAIYSKFKIKSHGSRVFVYLLNDNFISCDVLTHVVQKCWIFHRFNPPGKYGLVFLNLFARKLCVDVDDFLVRLNVLAILERLVDLLATTEYRTELVIGRHCLSVIYIFVLSQSNPCALLLFMMLWVCRSFAKDTQKTSEFSAVQYIYIYHNAVKAIYITNSREMWITQTHTCTSKYVRKYPKKVS